MYKGNKYRLYLFKNRSLNQKENKMKVLKILGEVSGFIFTIYLIIQLVVGASLINETQTDGYTEVLGLNVAKAYSLAILFHDLKFPDNKVHIIDFNDDAAVSAIMNR